MSYRPPAAPGQSASEWPAVVVALGILVLLGAVLVTATIRWTAADLRDLIGTLAPVLGVVTGAFVTYFFTRQANTTAVNAAKSAADAAAGQVESSQAQLKASQEEATSQTQRAQALHNALTTVMGRMANDEAATMLGDPAVKAALNPPPKP